MNTPITSEPKPLRRMTKEQRRPFGAQVQKLAYPTREGFHRHWFNDEPGRIDTALAAGYTHVEDKEGKKVQRVVGVNSAGGSLTAYLMETPEEWYQEDMRDQQKLVDERDEAIRKGSIAGAPGEDGRYVKHISIKRSSSPTG